MPPHLRLFGHFIFVCSHFPKPLSIISCPDLEWNVIIEFLTISIDQWLFCYESWLLRLMGFYQGLFQCNMVYQLSIILKCLTEIYPDNSYPLEGFILLNEPSRRQGSVLTCWLGLETNPSYLTKLLMDFSFINFLFSFSYNHWNNSFQIEFNRSHK